MDTTRQSDSNIPRLVFKGRCNGSDLKRLFACPHCGHKLGSVSFPHDDAEEINVLSQSCRLQTLTHGHTKLWCDACGEESEAREWGIDMWLFEHPIPDTSLEAAAETVRVARLAWFKVLREAQAIKYKQPIMICNQMQAGRCGITQCVFGKPHPEDSNCHAHGCPWEAWSGHSLDAICEQVNAEVK